MSLIEDIQAGAISEVGDVSILLRKCKLLAARLGNSDFASWVTGGPTVNSNGLPMSGGVDVTGHTYSQ